jgi:hypothetical protein
MGIAEQTFYRWRGNMRFGYPEIHQYRQLEEENRRLKRLVADLTLDKQMLQDVLSTLRPALRRVLIREMLALYQTARGGPFE